MMVRAVHFAFEFEPRTPAVATLYYPGDDRRLDEARLTGRLPAQDDSPWSPPWPVVIIMPGINIAPDCYRWLARRLVADGLCAVTYAAVGELGPAGRGITPGLDLAALAPGVAGTRCSATAVGPLLAGLGDLRGGDDPVAGRLDLDRVVVGGHSAGGTVALHNSTPAWIPGLRAVFAYGAHTMTSAALGHGEAAVLPVPAQVPVLLLAGADDRVIAASRDRYRPDGGSPRSGTPEGDATTPDPDHAEPAAHDPVGRTFTEAVSRDQQDSWLIELAGAGHFAICDPVDTTSGRSFLEPDTEHADPAGRVLLGDLIADFIGQALGRSDNVTFERHREHQLIGRWARK